MAIVPRLKNPVFNGQNTTQYKMPSEQKLISNLYLYHILAVRVFTQQRLSRNQYGCSIKNSVERTGFVIKETQNGIPTNSNMFKFKLFIVKILPLMSIP